MMHAFNELYDEAKAHNCKVLVCKPSPGHDGPLLVVVTNAALEHLYAAKADKATMTAIEAAVISIMRAHQSHCWQWPTPRLS